MELCYLYEDNGVSFLFNQHQFLFRVDVMKMCFLIDHTAYCISSDLRWKVKDFVSDEINCTILQGH